jgi:Cu(I)/Ag(I) efflux system membrane fusion protein
MNRRSRVVLVAGIVAAFSLASCSGDSASDGGNGMQGMEGMSGMEGMAGMGNDGSVRLTPDQIGTFGITFGSAEVRSLSREIRAVGIVEMDETRVAHVSPKFGGWAERLDVAFTGESVRAGQSLLEVYAPELIAAQEELLIARRMLDSAMGSNLQAAGGSAEEIYAAARRRLEYLDVSPSELDEILTSGEARRTLTVYAPASGIVTEKNIVLGQSFEPGQNLYVIADLSRVWVTAEIFEADFSLLREGLSTEVTVAGLPGRSFSGPIEYVYPTIGEQTRSLRARISLSNPRGELKPGMYATVGLTVSMGDALTVPASAVLYTGERAVTFVDMGDGSLTPQEVEVGMTGEDLIQVVSGLEPGQRVVTSAQFLLDSESNLAEVIRAMMAQMNLSDMGEMDMDMDMPMPESPGGR